jgi:hypothetical protein
MTLFDQFELSLPVSNTPALVAVKRSQQHAAMSVWK